jgi:glycosyltransferase involved in cell wall biosynthesis
MLAARDRQAVDPIVLLPEDGPLAPLLEAQAVEVRIQPTRWWIPGTHWSARTFLDQLEGLDERCDAMTRALDALRPDVVHTNVLVTLEGAAAAAAAGLPHVWHSRGLFGRGFPPPYLDDVPYFLGVVDRLGDCVVCVSRAVEREAAAYVGAERVVIPDGFDPEPLRWQPVEGRATLLARLDIAPHARLVVALGGIQRRKGQMYLLEALARLLPEFPGLVLVLAGPETDVAYADELRRFVAARGLSDGVRLPGELPDVRSLLSHAEIFVQPSLSEGFSLAVLEALACATPVVATKSGGPEEIVEEGVSGLLVEPSDSGALTRAIRRVLTEPDLAARLRREGPPRATRFSPGASASRLAEVYGRLQAPSPEEAAARALVARDARVEITGRARRAASA